MDEHSNRERGGLLQLYRALWHYAAGERPRVVLFMTLLVAAALVKLTIPFFTGASVTALQSPTLKAPA